MEQLKGWNPATQAPTGPDPNTDRGLWQIRQEQQITPIHVDMVQMLDRIGYPLDSALQGSRLIGSGDPILYHTWITSIIRTFTEAVKAGWNPTKLTGPQEHPVDTVAKFIRELGIGALGGPVGLIIAVAKKAIFAIFQAIAAAVSFPDRQAQNDRILQSLQPPPDFYCLIRFIQQIRDLYLAHYGPGSVQNLSHYSGRLTLWDFLRSVQQERQQQGKSPYPELPPAYLAALKDLLLSPYPGAFEAERLDYFCIFGDYFASSDARNDRIDQVCQLVRIHGSTDLNAIAAGVDLQKLSTCRRIYRRLQARIPGWIVWWNRAKG